MLLCIHFIKVECWLLELSFLFITKIHGIKLNSWEFLELKGDPTSPFWRRSVPGIHWKDWCWGWNSNTLGNSCEELTHLKSPWSWERLKMGGEGDDRGWDGWMASPTQWTWVWVNSGNWCWTRRPDVLQSMGSQRVGHDWVTELNWSVITSNVSGLNSPIKNRNWKIRLKSDPTIWCL